MWKNAFQKREKMWKMWRNVKNMKNVVHVEKHVFLNPFPSLN